MILVQQGNLSAFGDDPLKTPWWWSIVVRKWKQIQGIVEASAYDPEKMVAPRDIWMNEAELKKWFDEREKKDRVLPDY